MRRKRRSRGLWMPILGHREVNGEDAVAFTDSLIAPVQISTDSSLGDTQIVAPRPLVPDFTQEQFQNNTAADAGASLHDIASGNAWLLQRIVGKLYLKCDPNAVTGPASEIWTNVFVTAGFFVARADDDNQSVASLTGQESSPMRVDNAMNPWIWRRSWILGNPGQDANLRYSPTSTADYGSVADGPHVDSKVKRFISREHRLFFVVTARGFFRDFVNMLGEPGDQPLISGTLDYRIYGSLRRAKNSSSF